MGDSMPAMICDDDIDFALVLSEEEHHKVRPASDYADDVRAQLTLDPQGSKLYTPWQSLTKSFRPRPGELTVWTGFKGHGKTTALSQFELCLLGQGV